MKTTNKITSYCKYCGDKWLDGIKNIRKEPFICNACEGKQRELAQTFAGLLYAVKDFKEALDQTSVDKVFALQLLDEVTNLTETLKEARDSLKKYI